MHNKHRSNNSIARMTKWHGRNASKPMKRANNGLEKEKSIIKQGPTQEGSKT